MKEVTLLEYVDYFIAHHDGAASTRIKIGHLLRKATDEFGRATLGDLSTPQLRAWRCALRDAHQDSREPFEAFQALRQVLAQAVSEQIIDRNPSDGIRNPKPRPAEVEAFCTWSQVDAFTAEFPAHYRPMIGFWAATGLRPAELFALEWRDVDLSGRRIHVRRQLVDGETKAPKTTRSSRTVPLNEKARSALAVVSARTEAEEGIIFKTQIGTSINLRRWRKRTWHSAVEAAGLRSRKPYVMRHTYATLALRSGQSTYEVSRWMGTSIAMIDAHYGHLAADALDAAIERFNSYVGGHPEETNQT
jgi:integrase